MAGESVPPDPLGGDGDGPGGAAPWIGTPDPPGDLTQAVPCKAALAAFRKRYEAICAAGIQPAVGEAVEGLEATAVLRARAEAIIHPSTPETRA